MSRVFLKFFHKNLCQFVHIRGYFSNFSPDRRRRFHFSVHLQHDSPSATWFSSIRFLPPHGMIFPCAMICSCGMICHARYDCHARRFSSPPSSAALCGFALGSAGRLRSPEANAHGALCDRRTPKHRPTEGEAERMALSVARQKLLAPRPCPIPIEIVSPGRQWVLNLLSFHSFDGRIPLASPSRSIPVNCPKPKGEGRGGTGAECRADFIISKFIEIT